MAISKYQGQSVLTEQGTDAVNVPDGHDIETCTCHALISAVKAINLHAYPNYVDTVRAMSYTIRRAESQMQCKLTKSLVKVDESELFGRLFEEEEYKVVETIGSPLLDLEAVFTIYPCKSLLYTDIYKHAGYYGENTLKFIDDGSCPIHCICCWHTRMRGVLKIQDMETAHILNTLAYIRDKGDTITSNKSIGLWSEVGKRMDYFKSIFNLY
jgi:hypothetical protein